MPTSTPANPSQYMAKMLPQIREITRHLDNYPTSEVALTTTKRMVIKCPDGAVALTLSKELEALRYHCDVRPGRLSSAYYVQAEFRYPG